MDGRRRGSQHQGTLTSSNIGVVGMIYFVFYFAVFGGTVAGRFVSTITNQGKVVKKYKSGIFH